MKVKLRSTKALEIESLENQLKIIEEKVLRSKENIGLQRECFSLYKMHSILSKKV